MNLTNQPALDLDAIEATVTDQHLTPGPWDLAYESCDCGGDYPCGHGPYVTGVITPVPTSIAAERCKRTGEEPRDYDFHRGEIGDFTEADWALMVSARQNMPALVAEVRRLRADDLRAEIAKLARWHREDETAMKEMRGTIERLRAEKQELGELAARRESELFALRDRMEEIRHLHKDSPMGPCPVCIDADAAAAGGDGLMPYPCPTGRLAGAQDCDPPHVRAARYEAAGNAMAASLVRDGFGDGEIAEILAHPIKPAAGPAAG